MDEFEVIYRQSIRLRNGTRIHASRYGLKAFRFRVRRKPPQQPQLPGID